VPRSRSNRLSRKPVRREPETKEWPRRECVQCGMEGELDMFWVGGPVAEGAVVWDPAGNVVCGPCLERKWEDIKSAVAGRHQDV